MVTVKDFLNLPALKDELRIVAGTGGLNNQIVQVNIMDNPDALDWFSPGELLLTTGFFFKDSTELQNTVVRRLKEMNCAALCIKPRRYLPQIPQNILDLGNLLDLPVIEIPYGLAFSKISNHLLEILQDSYNEINRRSLDIQQSFFKISLQGGGIAQITAALSDMIGNPVVILDPFFNIVDAHERDGNPVPIDLLVRSDFSRLLKDSGYLENLPPDVDLLMLPLYRKLDYGEHSVKTLLVPINIQDSHFGYIFIWNTLRDLSGTDYLAIQHSTMSFALERIRKNEIQRTRNRVRRDFFEDLLTGRLTDLENLYYLCDLHQVNYFLKFAAIACSVEITPSKNSNLLEKKRYEDSKRREMLHYLDRYTADDFALYSFTLHGKLIILAGFSEIKKSSHAEAIKTLCLELYQGLRETVGGLRLRMGIGSIAQSVVDLPASYAHSLEALRLATSQINAPVCLYEEFLLQNFLNENISQTEMEKFFRVTLGKLADYDREHRAELLATLEMWFECSLNVSKTASALYTHRNTVLYRLEKISEILNADLKNPGERLKYQLAIKIHHLIAG